jgi:TPR repeat protein
MSTAWGDADALAEAGFCYAQGIGCKKDLKKSAKFYRQAEAKGISMIGNSWLVTLSLSSPFYYLIQWQDIQIQIQRRW